MKAGKIGRCRNRIGEPDYYRDRAIDMGEEFGRWSAICGLKHDSPGSLKRKNKAYRRMWWYILRDRERH